MNEQNILIVRCGEVALKGMNKPYFERMLVDRIRNNLKSFRGVDVRRSEGLIFVRADKALDIQAIIKEISKVFGVASISKAVEAPSELEAIGEETVAYMKSLIEERGIHTFKVEAKRADKKFPLNSPAICREVGGKILSKFHHLKVDVHNPDVIINVEVRDKCAFIHGNQLKGAGGMPSGSAGKAALLVSGGIDSPVAGWMMAKRGVELIAIHFASPPYTSQRAEQKVHSLLRQVAKYSGRIMLFVVPFTEIQELIKDNCPEEVFTLIMRRMMMRISQEIAIKEGCQALITGESVGQVASQTMPAIACTDAVTSMPVFRPLIGMDKDEVIAISRKIETFDISIQPYEDCCTVFTPKHPRTHPTIAGVEKAERGTEWDEPIKRAVEGTKVTVIKAFSKGE